MKTTYSVFLCVCFNSLPFVNVSLLKEKEQSWGHSFIFCKVVLAVSSLEAEVELAYKTFFFSFSWVDMCVVCWFGEQFYFSVQHIYWRVVLHGLPMDGSLKHDISLPSFASFDEIIVLCAPSEGVLYQFSAIVGRLTWGRKDAANTHSKIFF